MTLTQAAAFERFKALHEAATGFVMPNAWDGASAVLLRRAGFAALGTSSLAIAFALGRLDGVAAVTRADAVANGTLLAQVSGLPVNGDLEDGYGPDPQDPSKQICVREAPETGTSASGAERLSSTRSRAPARPRWSTRRSAAASR